MQEPSRGVQHPQGPRPWLASPICRSAVGLSSASMDLPFPPASMQPPRRGSGSTQGGSSSSAAGPQAGASGAKGSGSGAGQGPLDRFVSSMVGSAGGLVGAGASQGQQQEKQGQAQSKRQPRHPKEKKVGGSWGQSLLEFWLEVSGARWRKPGAWPSACTSHLWPRTYTHLLLALRCLTAPPHDLAALLPSLPPRTCALTGDTRAPLAPCDLHPPGHA